MSDFPQDAVAPSIADIDGLARAAFAALPPAIHARCPNLAILVEEFPDDDLLDEMGVEDPYELTGVYDGVDLRSRHLDGPATGPDRVVLFRRPILDEWVDRGNVTLAELVTHVMVHEIAHHLGMSDADIAAIDDWTA
jgi:predicted Zn-dependent protease with MMP-like domain